MLRYIRGRDLAALPKLQDSMHRDRTSQFRDRLKWDVSVDSNGWERDEYDDCDPHYVIWENRDGSHGGSMRFLPTSGRTMVNEHFAHLLASGLVSDPKIWECTRFCLSPNAATQVAGALMLAGGEVMRANDLSHLLGVFDARMVRIYNAIGASPDVLGSCGTGRDRISVGLWGFDPLDRGKVLRRARISSAISEHWYYRATGARLPRQKLR